MSLASFSIITIIDANGGISKEGVIPWNCYSNMKFFRDTTIGNGKNAVIMGRISYEAIPEEHRPLKNRHCVVVSSKWKQEEHTDVTVCSSLMEALITLGGSFKQYEDIFVLGGEQIYHEAVSRFMYLCKKIYLTKLKTEYDCDQFFPWDSVKDFDYFSDPQKTVEFVRYFICPKNYHEEHNYLKILKEFGNNSEPKKIGEGTHHVSLGIDMCFNLTNTIPIITTKKINYQNIIRNLLFFLSGNPEERDLNENIEESILPSLGFYLRHSNEKYEGCGKEYEGEDILFEVVNKLQSEPHSLNNHVFLNTNQSRESTIVPPISIIHFNVSGDKKNLDCQIYINRGNIVEDIPDYIVFCSLFLKIISHVSNLEARTLKIKIGQTFINSKDEDKINKQLSRTPRPFPVLKFRDPIRLCKIEDFNENSFIVENYSSWPRISCEHS